MEKLLLLGNNCHVDELIKNAKERGVHTVVTDNLDIQHSPVKAMADEAWDISIDDTDTLEKKCRAENVTAVLCGASETCLKANRDLCKRLGLPFYMEDKAWEITNDKALFKKACEECGVPVPKSYKLDMNFFDEDLSNIVYPIVVKPTDSSSSIGLHICHTKQELIEGYKDAYEKSPSHNVVVEEFIQGEQMGLIFTFINGEPMWIDSGDDVADKDDYQRRVFGFTPTKHKKKYDEDLKEPIEKLFKLLGCNEGVGCLQLITDGERYAALEMNYRLPGGKYPAEAVFINNMLNFVLNEKRELPKFDFTKNTSYGYGMWLKPGKIAEISGVEEVKKLIPGIVIQQLKHEGDVIEPNTGMRQIFAFVLFSCEYEKYEECLNILHSNLVVNSENGEDLLIKYRYDKRGYAVKE